MFRKKKLRKALYSGLTYQVYRLKSAKIDLMDVEISHNGKRENTIKTLFLDMLIDIDSCRYCKLFIENASKGF